MKVLAAGKPMVTSSASRLPQTVFHASSALRVIVAPLLQQAFHFGVMSCRDEKSRLAHHPW